MFQPGDQVILSRVQGPDGSILNSIWCGGCEKKHEGPFTVHKECPPGTNDHHQPMNSGLPELIVLLPCCKAPVWYYKLRFRYPPKTIEFKHIGALCSR